MVDHQQGQPPNAAQVLELHDTYLGSETVWRTLNGVEFAVTAHFGRVDLRAVCVGIDVRSFTSGPTDTPADRRPMPAWGELNSPRLRALRLAEVVEEAREHLQARLRWERGSDLIPTAIQEAHEFRLDTRIQDLEDVAPRRPGRPTTLTDDVLREVVAPAYVNGGRKPVRAVREALHRAGLPGSAADGSVTIDQARKAVQRARRRGILPPASTRGDR